MSDHRIHDPFGPASTDPDPLARIIALLRPSTAYSKLVEGHGPWRVGRFAIDHPFFCAVLDGACRYQLGNGAQHTLQAGDFALLPSVGKGFSSSSIDAPAGAPPMQPTQIAPGHFRLGDPRAPLATRMVVGHCEFASQDAQMLLSLLPRFVLVRGEPRLTTLLHLVNGEARDRRPGRDVVLARLSEVLLIEALRTTGGREAPAGLLRGLADTRIAASLRAIHDSPAHGWTIETLARVAGMSRSSFHDRFRHEVGMAPARYLTNWRMALAKDLLRREALPVGQVAAQVGYTCASTFSTAFNRHTGTSPSQFVRAARTSQPDPVTEI